MGNFPSNPGYEEPIEETGIQEIDTQLRIQRQRELALKRDALCSARLEEAAITISQIRLSQQEKKLDPISKLIQLKVTANVNVLNELALALGEQPLDKFPVKPYLEKELPQQSYEFTTNASLFNMPNSGFSIANIKSVYNIFNSLHYGLAKEKYNTVYKEGYGEPFMFHGTKQDCLDGICTYNFDRSKIRTHKFGRGISFATKPYYATHYHPENKWKQDKVMIISKVLVGQTFEIGSSTMTIPNQMCYTSKNLPQTVIVKYDDHTFLPVAIVHYRGVHQSRRSGIHSYIFRF